MRLLLISILLFISNLVFCQEQGQSQERNTNGSSQRPRNIDVSVTSATGMNTYQIEVDTTSAPLISRSGSNGAYYIYWVETGDGVRYKQKSFEHQYPFDSRYEIYAMATNRYDDGSKPSKKSAIVRGEGGSETDAYPRTSKIANRISYFPDTLETSIFLEASSDAKPNEEMTFMLSYRNNTETKMNGQLALLFNESRFGKTLFEEVAIRSHYKEKLLSLDTVSAYYEGHPSMILPSVEKGTESTLYSENLQGILDTATTTFSDKIVWSFEDLAKGEVRNLFFSLYNTPEMLEDTTAIITLLGIYTDDNGRISEYPLELEIVAAHDPNSASVSDTHENFRRFNKKKLSYKVEFQNEGDGEAQKVRITTAVPEGLDGFNIKVKKIKPATPFEGEKNPETSGLFTTVTSPDSISFLFEGITLYGMRQEGVSDEETTKGYVKFDIIPKRQVKKKTMRLQAGIFFDKEDPIYTNTAVTRFKPGLSIGVKGGISGFNFNEGLNSDYRFAGITFSPFKSEKWYYQGEVMFTRSTGENILDIIPFEELETNTNIIILDDNTRNELEGQIDIFISRENSELLDSIGVFRTNERNIIDVVPIQIRKNILPFLGVGVGGQLSLNFSSLSAINIDATIENTARPIFIRYNEEGEQNINVRPSVFADVNIGLVKQGPSIGVRYHQAFEDGQSTGFWRAYVLVKF